VSEQIAAVIFMSSFTIRLNGLQRFILQMHNDFETQVAASGLRYTLKESGSPFVGMGSSGATLSCIKCGNHKLRTRGAFRRYPSGLMFFCFDCKPKANHPCDARDALNNRSPNGVAVGQL
jgi:hypothetical protein